MEGEALDMALALPCKGEGAVVTFSRTELRAILEVYGRKVASGEWRDYAMSFSADAACFVAFCRSTDRSGFRIEKRPALARRQGAFAVIAADGRTFRRGSDIDAVLQAFRPSRQYGEYGKVLPFVRRPRRGV